MGCFLDREKPLMLNIPEAIVNLPIVMELLTSNENDPFMRSTIYVHTDDQTYKVLKRNFQPLVQ